MAGRLPARASTRCRRPAELRADMRARARRRCSSATWRPSATRCRSTSTTTCTSWPRSAGAAASARRAAGFRCRCRRAAPAAPARRSRVSSLADAVGKRERTKQANRAAILDGRARRVRRASATARRPCATSSGAPTWRPGTFYNYFPDKESVFAALVDETRGARRASACARRGAAARRCEAFVARRLPRLLRVHRSRTARTSSCCAATRARSAALFDEPALGAGRRGARRGPARRDRARPDPGRTTSSTWPPRWSARRSRSGPRCSRTTTPDPRAGDRRSSRALFIAGLAPRRA